MKSIKTQLIVYFSILILLSSVVIGFISINNAKNAGILAAKIAGISDENIAKKLEKYQKDLQSKVMESIDDIKKVHPNFFDK